MLTMLEQELRKMVATQTDTLTGPTPPRRYFPLRRGKWLKQLSITW